MGIFVKFWGTRGSIPTPGPRTRRYGGNTSCVEIRFGETLLICDGGSGLRELGIDLQRRGGGPVEAHLFFSHMHWDHIQGFPFFPPVYDPRSTIHIYDASGDSRGFEGLLGNQMQAAYFPVEFRDLGATLVNHAVTGDFEVDGIAVTIFEQTHPGASWAYGFEKDGVRIVYATDHELDKDLEDTELPSREPNALRPVRPAFLEFARGADLLIMDSQYTDEEYPFKVGWGHPRASTAVDAALGAGVKRLALYHHDPMHTDSEVENIVEDCRARAARGSEELEVFAAREGVELRLAR
ncbi:MAG: MBL fold metallo-hydrolase [Deltaproteobacteria bacterium]|nr:MBL fold metallo-hydrolase [Deltaproteobacteria bacterium]